MSSSKSSLLIQELSANATALAARVHAAERGVAALRHELPMAVLMTFLFSFVGMVLGAVAVFCYPELWPLRTMNEQQFVEALLRGQSIVAARMVFQSDLHRDDFIEEVAKAFRVKRATYIAGVMIVEKQ